MRADDIRPYTVRVGRDDPARRWFWAGQRGTACPVVTPYRRARTWRPR